MVKHTPGPWDRNGLVIYTLGESGNNSFCCGLDPSFLPDYDDEETQLANARLIQHAPKLFDLCEKFLDGYYIFEADDQYQCSFCLVKHSKPTDFPHNCDCPIIKARSVIKDINDG